jgi:light-regulated signal transduction histidine kinase (bacteriophytochrome)
MSSPGAGQTGPQESSDSRTMRQDYDLLRDRFRAEQVRHVEELRQFTYAISHDLREPLRMINSYTQLLQSRYKSQLDDDGQEFMKQVVDAAQRMDRLLSDLLTYSQQVGATGKPLAKVDTEAALEAVMMNLAKEIKDSGAQITHDPLPAVMFDFAQFSQVFRQLLANAMKFNSAQVPCIHVSAEEIVEGVVFSIRDNGVGIEPQYHDQIFGLFRRLHGREFPGTGIGLALCKRIVEQAGGRIWVESEAGSGAVFCFTVPS